jgi:hemolysin activation/secretion protein
VLYPVIRALTGSLDTQLSFNYENLADNVGATSTTDHRSSREISLSVNGNIRDDFLAGGITSGSVSYITGKLDVQDPTAYAIDQATTRTAGRFDKIGFTALRMQDLGSALRLYVSISGQLAGKNLDSSEKFNLGGPDAVRAYPQGEGVGDSGVVASVELRRLLLVSSPGVRPELVAFFDTGHITINRNPFLDQPNSSHLSGAGVGLNLLLAHGFRVRSSWAWKVGSSPAQSAPDSSSRGWIQFGKDF